MIFTYDLTNVNQMNGVQFVFGRAGRAVAQACRLIRPVKFLYYSQLVPLEETADDGLPIIFDDEVRYHAGTFNNDPAILLAKFTEYAAVIKRVKAMAPSCPISVYGILQATDYLTNLFGGGSAWLTARNLLTDLMDFAFADLGDGATPAAQFDALLADVANLRAQFTIPIMVKVNPMHCTDDEFKRRLLATVNSPNVDQVCIWMEGQATWPDSNIDMKLFPGEPSLTTGYWDIARDVARDHPGVREIKRRGMDRVLDYLMDQIAEKKAS